MFLLKLAKLSKYQRRLLLNATLLLGTVRVGMNILTFPKLRQMVAKHSVRPGGVPTPAPYTVENVTWAVQTAAQLLPGLSTCLAQALTAQILLTRRGVTPDLKIGVARSDSGAFQAHAWVENNGSVILGEQPDLARFLPMPNMKMK